MLKIKKAFFFALHAHRSVCCSLVSTPVRFLERGQGWVSASSKLRLAVSVFRRTEPSWKRNEKKRKKKKRDLKREIQKHMRRTDQTATRAKQIQPSAQVCYWKAGFSSARGLFVIRPDIIRDALTHFGFILQIPYAYRLGLWDNNVHFPPFGCGCLFYEKRIAVWAFLNDNCTFLRSPPPGSEFKGALVCLKGI